MLDSEGNGPIASRLGRVDLCLVRLHPTSSPHPKAQLHRQLDVKTTSCILLRPYVHFNFPYFRTEARTADVGAYTYGLGHPMKPHRIRVTHDLVSAYDMLGKMHVLVCYHILLFPPLD